jgi:Tfp pilus assembly protein PilZ
LKKGKTHRVVVRPMDIRQPRRGTMLNSEPQAGKYAVIARLLGLIHNLPKDQQVLLLKQLVGERVTKHLFKLIVEMSEKQQLLLLDQLSSPLETEPPERTLSLEETEPSMRENPRRPCLINADCRIQGNTFRSYILDISIGGVFIETGERVPVGETILLNFTLPAFSHPVALSGKIAWSGPQGFGVKFEGLPPPEGRAIKDYVDKEP